MARVFVPVLLALAFALALPTVPAARSLVSVVEDEGSLVLRLPADVATSSVRIERVDASNAVVSSHTVSTMTTADVQAVVKATVEQMLQDASSQLRVTLDGKANTAAVPSSGDITTAAAAAAQDVLSNALGDASSPLSTALAAAGRTDAQIGTVAETKVNALLQDSTSELSKAISSGSVALAADPDQVPCTAETNLLLGWRDQLEVCLDEKWTTATAPPGRTFGNPAESCQMVYSSVSSISDYFFVTTGDGAQRVYCDMTAGELSKVTTVYAGSDEQTPAPSCRYVKAYFPEMLPSLRWVSYGLDEGFQVYCGADGKASVFLVPTPHASNGYLFSQASNNNVNKCSGGCGLLSKLRDVTSPNGELTGDNFCDQNQYTFKYTNEAGGTEFTSEQLEALAHAADERDFEVKTMSCDDDSNSGPYYDHRIGFEVAPGAGGFHLLQDCSTNSDSCCEHAVSGGWPSFPFPQTICGEVTSGGGVFVAFDSPSNELKIWEDDTKTLRSMAAYRGPLGSARNPAASCNAIQAQAVDTVASGKFYLLDTSDDAGAVVLPVYCDFSKGANQAVTVYDGRSASRPGRTCKHLQDWFGGAAGVRWVTYGLDAPFQVRCDHNGKVVIFPESTPHAQNAYIFSEANDNSYAKCGDCSTNVLVSATASKGALIGYNKPCSDNQYTWKYRAINFGAGSTLTTEQLKALATTADNQNFAVRTRSCDDDSYHLDNHNIGFETYVGSGLFFEGEDCIGGNDNCCSTPKIGKSWDMAPFPNTICGALRSGGGVALYFETDDPRRTLRVWEDPTSTRADHAGKVGSSRMFPARNNGCAEVFASGQTTSGVYYVEETVGSADTVMAVHCDFSAAPGTITTQYSGLYQAYPAESCAQVAEQFGASNGLRWITLTLAEPFLITCMGNRITFFPDPTPHADNAYIFSETATNGMPKCSGSACRFDKLLRVKNNVGRIITQDRPCSSAVYEFTYRNYLGGDRLTSDQLIAIAAVGRSNRNFEVRTVSCDDDSTQSNNHHIGFETTPGSGQFHEDQDAVGGNDNCVNHKAVTGWDAFPIPLRVCGHLGSGGGVTVQIEHNSAENFLQVWS